MINEVDAWRWLLLGLASFVVAMRLESYQPGESFEVLRAGNSSSSLKVSSLGATRAGF